jgi:hypothetical protein
MQSKVIQHRGSERLADGLLELTDMAGFAFEPSLSTSLTHRQAAGRPYSAVAIRRVITPAF